MNKFIEYIPCGVCAQKIELCITPEKIVQSVYITGGCNGNSQGVATLCRGMDTNDIIDRLQGINCKGKGTSCPDQLAQALKKYLDRM